jgi:ATP-dependent RNA helicase DDX56/DBP9
MSDHSGNNTLLDPATTWTGLCDAVGIDVRLQKAVTARFQFARPTLVQSKCLALALSGGRDILVRAPTGTGKTLAYCMPLLQKLLQQQTTTTGTATTTSIGAVILVPTRELCTQVHDTLKVLTCYCDDVISVAVLSVGQGRGEAQKQDLARQEASLRDRPRIVVATPMGLLTQIRSKHVNLKDVETLVVDEADLVLSFGYSNDIAEIVKALPRICQGFLMSATLSPELDSLKKIVLNSPVVLKLEQDESKDILAGKLKQFYLALPKKDKYLVIYVFLKLGLLKGKGLFFVNSTDAGYRLKLFLEQFHIRAAVLNAELPFRSRLNIIEQFNVGSFDYLIATDASADAGNGGESSDEENDNDDEEHKPKQQKKRKNDSEYGVSRGLDFRNVSFVVNVDFPPNPRSYSHRVGRTARGGAKGVALSLVDIDSHEQVNALLAVQNDQPSVPFAVDAADKLQAVPTADTDGIQPITPHTRDHAQPMLLDFNLQEIEGFRYRVEDVSRAVTKIAVRETRAAELRAEILNSERLQSHFEENPQDLQLLQHDRIATHISRVQEHLKHVPKYLLPHGMQVANLNRKKKRKRNNGTGGARRSDNDPLQAFDGDANLDGVQDADEDPLADFMDDGENATKKQKTDVVDEKIFTNTKDGTGKSSAGRTAWKEKHKKGQFSGKKRLKDKKYKHPLGI